MNAVDLAQKSAENLEFMVDEIKRKLKMAAAGAIKPNHFSLEQYEDIKDIYDWVNSKETFSISEMESLVSEMGKLRNA